MEEFYCIPESCPRKHACKRYALNSDDPDAIYEVGEYRESMIGFCPDYIKDESDYK